LRACVAVEGEDRTEVFDDEDALVAELVEDAAGRVLCAVFACGAGEKRGDGQRADHPDAGEPVERRHDFGFAAARAADVHHPDGVALIHHVRDNGRKREKQRGWVGEMQVALERFLLALMRPRSSPSNVRRTFNPKVAGSIPERHDARVRGDPLAANYPDPARRVTPIGLRVRRTWRF
jgi:hypothetical protein